MTIQGFVQEFLLERGVGAIPTYIIGEFITLHAHT